MAAALSAVHKQELDGLWRFGTSKQFGSVLLLDAQAVHSRYQRGR
jgi:hypothetical protein